MRSVYGNKTLNRLLRCPACGERLGSDKKPYLKEDGTTLRRRACPACGAVVYSRQAAEVVTGLEVPPGGVEMGA